MTHDQVAIVLDRRGLVAAAVGLDRRRRRLALRGARSHALAAGRVVAVVAVAGRRRRRGRHRPGDVPLRPRPRRGAPGRARSPAVVSLAFALARRRRPSSRWLAVAARGRRARFGESGRFDADGAGPAELAALGDELPRSQRAARRVPRARAAARGSRAASWSPGSPTTCARRWPGCARWPRRSRTAWPTDPARYHRQMRAEVDRMVARWSTTCSSCPGSTPACCGSACSRWRCGDLVSEAIAGADPVARAAGVRLGGAGRRRTSLVRADPAGLSRVVANLLMNAIRHTPADGAVESWPGRATRRRRAQRHRRLRRHPGGRPRPRLRRRLARQPRAGPRESPDSRRRARAGDRPGHRRGAPGHVAVAQPRARLPVPGPPARLTRTGPGPRRDVGPGPSQGRTGGGGVERAALTAGDTSPRPRRTPAYR